jgi:hypothetical protein
LRRVALSAALVAALLLPACGPKAITVGSRPFPSGRPVFADASGNPLAALPAAKEPWRLVLLDFPWCPACGDSWKAVLASSASFPPGTVHVYRVRFDRETLITRASVREVPPLLPPPRETAGAPRVTALTALPDAFRQEYRVSQAPVLLLLSPDGTVARRWIGYEEGLSGEISEEIRKRSLRPSALPPER